MTYPEFAARWQPSGGAERANYGLFLTDLCDLLGVPRPDATTDSPTQDAYVLERAVTFDDGGGRRSTGRIDLYKRGCFVLETKQGVDGFATVKGNNALGQSTPGAVHSWGSPLLGQSTPGAVHSWGSPLA